MQAQLGARQVVADLFLLVQVITAAGRPSQQHDAGQQREPQRTARSFASGRVTQTERRGDARAVRVIVGQLIEARQQHLAVGKPLIRLFRQHAVEQPLVVLQMRRQLRHVHLQVVHHGLGVVGGAVGITAREHLQQDHPQAVDITARIQCLALRLFGAAVGRAADGDAELGQVMVQLDFLGHAKVGDHRRAVAAKEDVGRFDIAVYQAFVMHHRQAAGHLLHDTQRARQVEHLALVLRQIATRDELHSQVVATIGELVDVIDGDD